MILGRRFQARDDGAAAAEFAILLPALFMLVMGILGSSLLMQTLGSLRYAVEGAARCAAVRITQCANTTATQNYAQSIYYGPSNPVPVFAASTLACGSQVSGTLTFTLDIVIKTWSIPLSATACFP